MYKGKKPDGRTKCEFDPHLVDVVQRVRKYDKEKKCLNSSFPYTAYFRGAPYCSDNPIHLLKYYAYWWKNFESDRFILRNVYELIQHMYESKLPYEAYLRELYTNVARQASEGFLLGLATLFVSYWAKYACMIGSERLGLSELGAQARNFFPAAMKAPNLNFTEQMQKALKDIIAKFKHDLEATLTVNLNEASRRMRLYASVMGAQEEYLFRNPDMFHQLVEGLTPKCLDFAKRLATQLNLNQDNAAMYAMTILHLVTSSIAFGLVHLSNYSAHGKIVFCQVFFTTVLGVFLETFRLIRGGNDILTLWFAHFMHNYVAITGGAKPQEAGFSDIEALNPIAMQTIVNKFFMIPEGTRDR